MYLQSQKIRKSVHLLILQTNTVDTVTAELMQKGKDRTVHTNTDYTKGEGLHVTVRGREGEDEKYTVR